MLLLKRARETVIQSSWAYRLFLLALACLFIVGLRLSLMQFSSFNSYHPRDMATVIHPLFQTVFAGNFMFCNLDGLKMFLTTHLSIWKFLSLPFILLAPYVETMIILKTVWMFIGIWFLFKISLRLTGSEGIAALIALAYAVSSPFQRILLNDVRLISFYPTFILITFYFYMSRKFLPFIIFLALTYLNRDEGIVAVIMFPIIEMLSVLLNRLRNPLSPVPEKTNLIRYTVIPMAVIAALFLSVTILLKHSLIKAAGMDQLNRFFMLAEYGDNSVSIIRTILSDPFRIIRDIFLVGPKWNFFIKDLFLPLLFLPLAGPQIFLMALPGIALYFFFPYPETLSISSPYSLETAGVRYLNFFLPYLFIAFPFAFRNIQLIIRNQKTSRTVCIILSCIVIVAGLGQSPMNLPLSTKYDATRFTDSFRNKRIKEMIRVIGRKDRVTTQFDYLAWFANRLYISDINFAWHYDYESMPLGDFMFLDLKRRWYFNLDRFFYNMWQARESIQNPYQIVDSHDGAVLLARGTALEKIGVKKGQSSEPFWNLVFSDQFPGKFSERFADMKPSSTPPTEHFLTIRNSLILYRPSIRKAGRTAAVTLPARLKTPIFRKYGFHPVPEDGLADQILLVFNFVSGTDNFQHPAIKPVVPIRFWEQDIPYDCLLSLDLSRLSTGKRYSVYLDIFFDETMEKMTPSPLYVADITM